MYFRLVKSTPCCGLPLLMVSLCEVSVTHGQHGPKILHGKFLKHAIQSFKLHVIMNTMMKSRAVSHRTWIMSLFFSKLSVLSGPLSQYPSACVQVTLMLLNNGPTV